MAATRTRTKDIPLQTRRPCSSRPLPPIPQQAQSQPQSKSNPKPKPKPKPYLQEPRVESIRMDRSDSGYEEGSIAGNRSSTEGARRISTSSRTANKDDRRRSSPRTSTSNRPQQRRKERSTPSTSTIASNSGNSPRKSTSEWRAGAPRPSLHARHTTPYHSSTNSAQYPAQYFHFPPISLSTDPSPPHTRQNEEAVSPQSPPPATVHYWTSDSTRRLEYAAIDAASKGVRGFVMKLIPDCFLPGKVKRSRFHNENDDGASDAGSVRRYRLSLPEETVDKELQDVRVQDEPRRPFLRRWTTFGMSGAKKDA